MGVQEHELLTLIGDTLAADAPQLLEAFERVETGTVTPNELKAMFDVVVDRFLREGLDDDWEPTAQGLVIEDAADLLMRRRIELLEGDSPDDRD